MENKMINEPIYPVGIQDFENIRERNAVYVDKTDLIYRLTHTSKYVFLSRPRRFGKSLLSSTLQYYFEGRRDLFAGLAMDGLETEWTVYPVLHFDLSTAKQETVEKMEAVISRQLNQFEAIYGANDKELTIGSRLDGVIQRAYQRTGRKAVVLIDEYDAPILHVLHESTALRNDIRTSLSEFYSPLKACDPYLHFVFITGVSTFSQMSIFSALNNLTNITMESRYAAICGITETEVRSCFKPGIHQLALNLKCTDEEALQRLKRMYDGYHFAKKSEDIYNPFSLLRALQSGELGSYWFETGTPTFLLNQMQRFEADLSELEEEDYSITSFNVPIEMMKSALPLLYQTGYITQKAYDEERDMYRLGIPNNEVRVSLMENLIPLYTNTRKDTRGMAINFAYAIKHNRMDEALQLLRSFFASIPYPEAGESQMKDPAYYEWYYSRIFYTVFSMFNVGVQTEVRSARGRADMVMFLPETIYVFEFKIDNSVSEALAQIESKGYAIPYEADGRRVVKVGVTFSSQTRTIEDWKAVE
jgi:hypothetical protein